MAKPGTTFDVATPPTPQRREILSGVTALLASTALPVAALGVVTLARPGGWILLESDRDVS